MRTCQRCEKPLTGQRRKWCSENCRKRACDDAHRAPCPECGQPMGSRTGFRGGTRHERCWECRKRLDVVAHRLLIEDVAEMYREGMSIREIAAELGYGPTTKPPQITEARRLGLIGYRYRAWENRSSGEDVAA